MLFGQVLGGIAVLGSGVTALSLSLGKRACSEALLIDDFNNWSSAENNLNGATSDDGTMRTATVENGILTFSPNMTIDSYLYEQFPCTATAAEGYDTLSITLKGPEAASVGLELQTKLGGCAAETPESEYEAHYYTVNGLSGQMQTITVPLSAWEGANLDSVVGVLLYGFSAGLTGTDNVWQIDNIGLLCANGGGLLPTEAPPPPPPEPSDTPTNVPPGWTPTTATTTVIITSQLPEPPTVTISVTTWIPDDPGDPEPTDPNNPWVTPTTNAPPPPPVPTTSIPRPPVPTTTTRVIPGIPGQPTRTTRLPWPTRRTTSRYIPRPTYTWPGWGDDDDDDPWWGEDPWYGEQTQGNANSNSPNPSPSSENSNVDKSQVKEDADTKVKERAEQWTTDPSVASSDQAQACENVLIDDWQSQSRLTFLYYNAMLKSSSDDGTMKSVVVSNNKVTMTPTNTESYFYSQLGCLNAKDYGGISLRITAPAGSQFNVELGACSSGENTVSLTTKELGWTFNGREQLYSIPFARYTAQGLDLNTLDAVVLSSLSTTLTMGPIAMYCGSTVVEYVAPAPVEPAEPTATVAAPAGPAASNLIIERFAASASAELNALGNWHGADEGMTASIRNGRMTLQTADSDLMWVTQVSETCRDMTGFLGSYLHIAYTGSNKFSVALRQHNEGCNENVMPFPETWDSLEAARYSSASDIYIPMNHFNVNHSRIIDVALKGFYTTTATVISRIEIVNQVPARWTVPVKMPSGTFVMGCKRPNSFAFAIDDGDPALAAQVMQTVREENIVVTFFTVGAALQDPTTNLTNIYRDMAAAGHQVAMHSYTHPKLESLTEDSAIDWEYTNMIRTLSESFDGMHTPYFRAPFGTEGARMRQRLAALVDDPYIVQWSVDVEDWMWAESTTPEKQLDAFKRDVAAGGNLVVMHYLYPSTVGYLKQFIQIAKATGKQLMRVDQCMMDPNAPPLP